ncbi:hypothetical protein [Candidatus Stoquefichus massiliensis]|uniref:hypothetical protein n=1 Tax=Candidatus Stoquefichus massiliensis TaxID=1470350 RepID=UPI000485F502|nr:hypothetical protein [Candidatus Stoquefichus massiliensis]
MKENKVRKVIIMALAGALIGSLLFIFGVSVEGSLWPMIINYMIALMLYMASFLAVFNNNKQDSQALYKYVMIVDIGLILLITIVLISKLI